MLKFTSYEYIYWLSSFLHVEENGPLLDIEICDT